MFLSGIYSKSRTSQPIILCQQEGWRGTRSCEETQPHSWWPQVAKRMFLTVQHHAQYIRGGQSWSEGAAQGLAGHHLASGEHLPCASLVLYILGFFLITVIIIIFFRSVPLNCLYCNSCILSLLLFQVFPIPLWRGGGGGSEALGVWCLASGWS